GSVQTEAMRCRSLRVTRQSPSREQPSSSGTWAGRRVHWHTSWRPMLPPRDFMITATTRATCFSVRRQGPSRAEQLPAMAETNGRWRQSAYREGWCSCCRGADGSRDYSSSLSSSGFLLVAKSSISGNSSSGESSSSVKERPVLLRGIGPRGRSASFFFALALPPRCGFASGPKFRLREAGGGGGGSNGLGPPP